MCTVPALMGTRRGYIVSPGYPRRYPVSTSRNCSVTIVVPSSSVVRLRVLDMLLASYTASNRRTCLDRSAVSCRLLNNFIRRKTVEVQYKQRAIHEKNKRDKVAGYV